MRRMALTGFAAAAASVFVARAVTENRPTTPTAVGSASGAPRETTGDCNAAKAAWAVGQRENASLLERARVAANAKTARFLRPNQPTTREFLRSRLNLDLDAAGIVRSVRCG